MTFFNSQIIICVLVLVLTGCASSTNNPGIRLEYNQFSEADWSQARIGDAFLLAENFGTSALIVMTHGKMIEARSP